MNYLLLLQRRRLRVRIDLLYFLITSTKSTWCSAEQCCRVAGTELNILKHQNTHAEKPEKPLTIQNINLSKSATQSHRIKISPSQITLIFRSNYPSKNYIEPQNNKQKTYLASVCSLLLKLMSYLQHIW